MYVKLRLIMPNHRPIKYFIRNILVLDICTFINAPLTSPLYISEITEWSSRNYLYPKNLCYLIYVSSPFSSELHRNILFS